MADLLTTYDRFLAPDSDIAALVIREHLVPVEGADGVVFPATFAAAEDKSQFPGGYNIDIFPDGKNVCLIDSVGSQANRIEPIFATAEYAKLVPQIIVKAGEKRINLIFAGHRAGDALIRCSAMHKELREAFKADRNGNAEPLAKIAPTSLVFGVWDSRDTQTKLPRLIASTIRAYDVCKLTRSAQFIPATEYTDDGLLEDSTDKKVRDEYAKRGFVHVPSSGSPGGVIATGGIRRDATLSLAALRLLSPSQDATRTLSLRRYVFGLALTALTHPPSAYLRQGCNLVLDPEKQREFVEVHIDGKRVAASISHADALKFASAAAKAFGVGDSRTVTFDTKLAERDLAGNGAAEGSKSKKTEKK